MVSKGILDFGRVELPRWENMPEGKATSQSQAAGRKAVQTRGVRRAFIMEDVNHIRTHVRKMRYGEDYNNRPEGYRVEVVWPNGEVAEWTFAPNVGWPVETGNEHIDWKAELMNVG